MDRLNLRKCAECGPTARQVALLGSGLPLTLPARLLLLAVAFFLVTSTAWARSAPLNLVGGDIRSGLDLSGSWHWSVDPFRDGLAGFHGEEPSLGRKRYADLEVAAEERKNPSALFEQDLQRSPVVTLPSSWITHDPSMRYFDSLVWYQRNFEAHPKAGERQFLRFGAVDYFARVYLNGQLVGTHEGGFTPFALEVTGKLRPGKNQITVGVDSQRTADTVPPVVVDWDTYGGITRPVRLVSTPAIFVDDAWVRLDRNGRIQADIALNGEGAAGRDVRVRIPALGFTMSGRTDSSGRWSGQAPAPRGMKRWSPESPTLYDVLFESGDDTLQDRVGFRTVEVRGKDILLNGRPIFLRGICLHEEEFGKEPTRAITSAAARALLSEVKHGLNGNFVRLAHYPHSEVMTRMADEMGLLVWSEIPVYWRVNFESEKSLALARAMMAENIVRDRNRASVMFWSVGNETPLSDARNAFLKTLAADVKALDDTRLVTAALLTKRDDTSGTPVITIDDPLAEAFDVLAINTYNGWYTEDQLADLPSIRWEVTQNKPLVLSEFGADAKEGFRDAERLTKFSEDFQAEYYRRTLEMAEQIPSLRGLVPWLLKDFRSPRRQHPIYQQGWNRKGVVTETGERKEAFRVLADHYKELSAKGR